MRAVVSERAQDDLVDAVRWLADQSTNAADRLLDELEEACDTLGEWPGLGGYRYWLRDERLRAYDLTKWTIVYRSDLRPPVIVRLLHSSSNVVGLEL